MANLREVQSANKLLLLAGIVLVAVAGLVYFLVFYSPLKTYNNKDYGITIDYPANWEMHERVEGSVVVFASPAQTTMDVFRENVNVAIQDLSTNHLTLDQFTDVATKQLTAVFNNVKIVSSTPATLAGRPAHQIVYVATGDTNLKIMHIWFVENNMAYTVTYTAAESKYDEFLGTANKMIKSFKVEL